MCDKRCNGVILIHKKQWNSIIYRKINWTNIIISKLNQTQKDNHFPHLCGILRKNWWANNIKVKEKLLGMYMGKGKKKGG